MVAEKHPELTAVRAVVAVEAEEGQDDLATCTRARWHHSEADMMRHLTIDERPGQKKMSTSPRGSRQAPKCHQLNLYRWVWAYPQIVLYSGRDGRRLEKFPNPANQSELRGLSRSTG